MTKSILFSVIAIGVAATVIGFAATQAAFTDSQTASGDVNAGTVNLYLLEIADDDNGENEIVFEPTENLLPGGFATDSLSLKNTGTAPITISSLNFGGGVGANCDGGNPGDEYSPSITGVLVGDVIAPGATQQATVRVDLSALAGNPCQGSTYNFSLVVTVSS